MRPKLLDRVTRAEDARDLGRGQFSQKSATHEGQCRSADARAAGDGDDLRVRLGLAHLRDGLDAFLFRHDDVGDDEVRLRAAEQSHTAQTVDGSSHLVAGVLQE
jgi:hypothetical protein